MIEHITAMLPDWAELFFYRTQDGTEADLVITRGGMPEILLEVKYSTVPKPGKGFYIAQTDLAAKRNVIVSPVEKGLLLAGDVAVISYRELAGLFWV